MSHLACNWLQAVCNFHCAKFSRIAPEEPSANCNCTRATMKCDSLEEQSNEYDCECVRSVGGHVFLGSSNRLLCYVTADATTESAPCGPITCTLFSQSYSFFTFSLPLGLKWLLNLIRLLHYFYFAVICCFTLLTAPGPLYLLLNTVN